MTSLQLAGGGDNLQICRVARIVEGATKGPLCVYERQDNFFKSKYEKAVLFDAADQEETAKSLCDLTFDTRTEACLAHPGISVRVWG
jgi:hypothetical protein